MKRKILAIVLLSLIVSPTHTLIGAKANSAQRSFTGSYASGLIVTDPNSPIRVIKEDLVFNIDSFPNNYNETLLNYNNYVSATYTFENPADYDVTAQLAFPFGNQPDYLSTDIYNDISNKYDVKVNDLPVSKKIRHTFSSNGGRFDITKDLARLRDEVQVDPRFNSSMEIYRYTLKINSSYIPPRGGESRSVILTVPSTFDASILSLNYVGVNTGSVNNQMLLNVYNQQAFDVYVLGDALDDISDRLTFVDNHNNQNIYQGTTTIIEKKQLSFEQLAKLYFDEDGPVSETDYINAVIDRLNHHQEIRAIYNTINILYVNHSLLSWYDYEITINSHQTITNEVIAPLFPAIRTDYTPPIYDFTYLLTPASTWESFANLTIKINTPYFLTTSNLPGFTKTDHGYELFIAELPTNDFEFRLSTDANPQRNTLSGFGFLFSILAGIGAVIGIYALTMYALGGLVLIVFFTVKAMRKPTKK